MQLTYAGVTIDFFNEPFPKQILLSLSGGLDSASLFYLICKYFPEREIIPFTGKDIYAPFDALNAQDITDWMQEEFPHVKIHKRYEFEYDHFDPYWYEIAKTQWEDHKVVLNGKKIDRANAYEGLAKILIIRDEKKKLRQKYPGALICSGITKNPPIKEMKKYNFYEKAERRRDAVEEFPQYKFGKLIDAIGEYGPYRNVDKKFIADIYVQHNLMETLYPLTGSCIGTYKTTDYFTKECHDCFWCYEKKWAFDLKWI